ncbi:MAG TPA: redoxin domain-containing protein [Candidatus Paceibacterota bacterium]
MAGDSLIGVHAPDFPLGLSWVRSQELSLAGLRGKIIFIDFWTYSCVNCIRTLPCLKKWYEAYKDKGLVIIGIHTPEFQFEKDPENVRRAVEGFGINYPVVLDPDFLVWNLYANHWWPRHLLIDGEGKIIYDHIGEGAYEETGDAIKKALGVGTSDARAVLHSKESPKICYPMTPELYLGYERGYIGNPSGFKRDTVVGYKDTDKDHKQNTVYLHGSWMVSREYLEHARGSLDDYLLLNFLGTEVNIVAEKIGGAGSLLILLDGRKLPPLTVSHPQMLNLVKRKDAGSAFLKLIPREAGIRLYTFTFGGCVE